MMVTNPACEGPAVSAALLYGSQEIQYTHPEPARPPLADPEAS